MLKNGRVFEKCRRFFQSKNKEELEIFTYNNVTGKARGRDAIVNDIFLNVIVDTGPFMDKKFIWLSSFRRTAISNCYGKWQGSTGEVTSQISRTVSDRK